MTKKILYCFLLLVTTPVVFAQNTIYESAIDRWSEQLISFINKHEDKHSSSQIIATIHHKIQKSSQYWKRSIESSEVLYHILQKLYIMEYWKELVKKYTSPLWFSLLLPIYIEWLTGKKRLLIPREHENESDLLWHDEQTSSSWFMRITRAESVEELEVNLTDLANKNRTDTHICSFAYHYEPEQSSWNIEIQMYMWDDNDEKCIRNHFNAIIWNPKVWKAAYRSTWHEPAYRVPVTLIDWTQEILFLDPIVRRSIDLE